jgi:acetylornithine deacetylase/succinyl-diaminopimelate desuccinylase-like protein
LQYVANQGPASLMLDCRLINQRKDHLDTLSHAEEFRRELDRLLNPSKVPSAERAQIVLDVGWNYSSSPKDTVYFRAMQKALNEQFPGVEVAAFMTPGGTDNTYFRDPHNAGATAFPNGIPSYGFTPLLVNPKVMATFHNSNERFPVLQAVPAVKSYASLMQQLTAPP